MAETTQEKAEEQISADIAKIDKLAGFGHEDPILYTLTSVFPYDFFPTKMSIEKTKVNIVRHIFFGAREIESILISEISNVEVFTSLFFASLQVTVRLPSVPPKVVKYLRVDETLRAQRIIQGLMTRLSLHVDLYQA